MKKSMTGFRSYFQDEALVRADRADSIRQALPEDATKREQDRVKTQLTHANFDMKLAEMSDAAIKYALEQLGAAKASEIESQSRELKKRTVAILEAVGNGSELSDRALDAVIQFIVAKNAERLTTMDMQREAQHQTPTQANYMKTAFKFLGIASEVNKIGKGVWEVRLDPENKTLADLKSLYQS